MASPLQGRALVDEALRRLLAKDMAGFADLWAHDGVIEFPFAAPGYPEGVEGRPAIAAYMAHYPDLLDVRAVTSEVVHETTDPDVVVVEFEVDGVVVATGRPYHLGYIAVITSRAGEITRYRDYWSPLAAAEAMGGVETVNSSFSAGVSSS